MRARLLDLFCGAGGCSVGYHRAGFDVVGVDIEPQSNYPYRFIQDDALDYLHDGGGELRGWAEAFDAIHASPPCQDYSRAMRHLAYPHPRLIDPVRELLEATGLPWVIENVPGAPLPTQSDLLGRHGVELCGTMFGLSVYRHRLFEMNFAISPPRPCNHSQRAMNPHNQAGRDRITAQFGPGDQERPWREDMGVEWMSRYEAREAIPPAYTEHIGHYLLTEIQAKAAA